MLHSLTSIPKHKFQKILVENTIIAIEINKLRRTIGIMVRVFTNRQGDRGSIPGRVIPKTQRMVLNASLLKNQYGSRVKWSNPEEGVAPSLTTRCCSYWKGSLRVALDYGRQLYIYLQIPEAVYICTLMIHRLTPTNIYIYIYISHIWKKIPVLQLNFWKFSLIRQQYWNNKIENNDYRFLNPYPLEIKVPTSLNPILKRMLMYTSVLDTVAIYKTKLNSKKEENMLQPYSSTNKKLDD